VINATVQKALEQFSEDHDSGSIASLYSSFKLFDGPIGGVDILIVHNRKQDERRFMVSIAFQLLWIINNRH